MPTERPATLSELAGVSDDLGELEDRVKALEDEQRKAGEIRAEWVGRRGDGGPDTRLGRIETSGKDHTVRLAALETWRTGIVAKWAVVGVIVTAGGGVVAALAVEFVKYLVAR